MQDAYQVLDLHLLLDIIPTSKTSTNPEENFDMVLLDELSPMHEISKVTSF